MTLIGACRDTLRVIRAERSVKPEELRRTLDKVETLTGKINELRHDGWRGYAPLVYDNEKVVPHSEEFVTDEGVTSTKSNVSGHSSIRGCRSSAAS